MVLCLLFSSFNFLPAPLQAIAFEAVAACILTGNIIALPFSFFLAPFPIPAGSTLTLIALAALLAAVLLLLAFIFRGRQLDKTRIRQSEQTLGKVMQYLPTGIIIVDPMGRVSHANNAALRLFEIEDPDLLIGQPPAEKLFFSRLKVVRKEELSTVGARYIIADAFGNEKILYNEKNLFYLQSRKYVIHTYQDWSLFTRKATSSKSALHSGFLANISHELRTPLNGIIGMTDLLLNSSQVPAQEREMAQVAKRSAETLLSLINDILDYSKIEAGKFEHESIPFNLKEEVKSVIREISPLAREKKIKITLNLGEVLPSDFIGDPVRVRQILNNLVNNAIKFTPGGTIDVSAYPWKTPAGAPAIMLSIKDTGIGIRPGKLKSIFDPFVMGDESTTRAYGGSGLGTTICKQLVNLMGGEIWVKSPSGISASEKLPGAEFCFTLPLKTRVHQKKLDFSTVLTYPQIKVLVVTDDAMQVQVLSRNLIAMGVYFQVVPPTIETVEALKAGSNFHSIIIDHRHDLNGLEFLNELHNNNIHDKFLVIVQSSDFESSNTALARRLGADAYLRKPVSLPTLRHLVARYFTNLRAREISASLSIPDTISVLLIEEVSLNQKVIANLLQKSGYNVQVFGGVNEAITASPISRVDVVLMGAPRDMDKVESAIIALRSVNVKCPVVLVWLSSVIDPGTRKTFLEAGCSDFLLKPVTRESLSFMVNKWGVGAALKEDA